MTRNKKIIILGGAILIIGVAVFVLFFQFLAPQRQAEFEQFTVPLGADAMRDNQNAIVHNLKEKGFIKAEWAFKFVLSNADIEPGAYKISKSMNVWQIAEIIKKGPYMKWVVIPEGLRKEQIAEILAKTLNWNEQEKSDWVTKYTAMNWDYVEGMYFPDTYLIPVDERGLQIAQRFINKFNEKFALYSDKFLEANIKWDTALKIASIVQREAAGKDDMPLIAGIIWNRLLKGMKLEIDATLQYARDSEMAFDDLCKKPGLSEEWQCQCGEEDDDCYRPRGYYKGIEDWWMPISIEDKQIDSAYNTYLNVGLPPHPIANPGLDAIDAVLNSAETDCLYYLHDSDAQIHCAETYEEHQQNIEKYLK